MSNTYKIEDIKDDEIIQVIIDNETGEITGYIRKGDKLIKRESTKAYQDKKSMFEPNDKRKFTKNFHNELKAVTKLRLRNRLSIAGELLFRTMGDYLDFSGDNIVKINDKAMGTKTIGGKLLGYGKTQTTKLIRELIDLNLIAKVKRGRNVIYIMNPQYYHRGKVLKTTTTIFKLKTDNIEWDKEFLDKKTGQ